ncbi:MAG: hypothetical protein AAF823_12010 [Planctomycetota bacterium]
MAKAQNTGISVGVMNAIVGAIVLTIVLFTSPPLRTARPPGERIQEQPIYADQSTPARLWQDPLGPFSADPKVRPPVSEAAFMEQIFRRAETIAKNNSAAPDQDSENQKNKAASESEDGDNKTQTKKPERLVVMPVLISGQSYPYDQEQRIRTRLAVLTGLNAAKLLPESPNQLGRVRLSIPADAPSTASNPAYPQLNLTLQLSGFRLSVPTDASPPASNRPPPQQILALQLGWVHLSVSADITPIASNPAAPQQTLTFEWFRPFYYTSLSQEQRIGSLLVLWYPEELLGRYPIQHLEDLRIQLTGKLEQLEQQKKFEVDFKVIGPRTSDTLWDMHREWQAFPKPRPQYQLFAATPTAWDSFLRHKPMSDEAERPKNEADSLPVKRPFPTDDELCRVLIDELIRRGIDPRNPKHVVAVVSEWDTAYGRALPVTFQTLYELRARGVEPESKSESDKVASLLSQLAGVGPAQAKDDWKTKVIRMVFVRGIDGRLHTPSNPQTLAGSAINRSAGRVAERTAGVPLPESSGLFANPYAARVEGPAQMDYLQRMADELDRRLYFIRNPPTLIGPDLDDARDTADSVSDESSADSSGEARQGELGENFEIRAIGVLGADVYDKLLVIQVLRRRFPHAVFFTTELDARLYHREEVADTRHLIVASSIEYQRWAQKTLPGRPPAPSRPVFRDDSQYRVAAIIEHALTHSQPDKNSENKTQDTANSKPEDTAKAKSDPTSEYEIIKASWIPSLYEIGRLGPLQLDDIYEEITRDQRKNDEPDFIRIKDATAGVAWADFWQSANKLLFMVPAGLAFLIVATYVFFVALHASLRFATRKWPGQPDHESEKDLKKKRQILENRPQRLREASDLTLRIKRSIENTLSLRNPYLNHKSTSEAKANSKIDLPWWARTERLIGRLIARQDRDRTTLSRLPSNNKQQIPRKSWREQSERILMRGQARRIILWAAVIGLIYVPSALLLLFTLVGLFFAQAEWELIDSQFYGQGVTIVPVLAGRALAIGLGLGVVIHARIRAKRWHRRAAKLYGFPYRIKSVYDNPDRFREANRIYGRKFLRKHRRAWESLSFNHWYGLWPWAIMAVFILATIVLGRHQSTARGLPAQLLFDWSGALAALVLFWAAVSVGWITWTHLTMLRALQPEKTEWHVYPNSKTKSIRAMQQFGPLMQDTAMTRSPTKSILMALRFKLKVDICDRVFAFVEPLLPWPAILFGLLMLSRMSFWDQISGSEVTALFAALTSAYCLYLISWAMSRRRAIRDNAVAMLREARVAVVAPTPEGRAQKLQDALQTYVAELEQVRRHSWWQWLASPAVLPILLPLVTLFMWFTRN